MSFFASAILGVATLIMNGELPSDADWQRVVTLDEEISFEVPCSSDEIQFRTEGVEDFSGSSEARCEYSDIAFLVIVSNFPSDIATPAFDSVVRGLVDGDGDQAERIDLEIAGHRTHADRASHDDVVAQRAIVEISPTKIAMLIAGGEASAAPSNKEKQDIVDRFFGSVEVVGL